jgi:hypothetical protein
MAIAAWNAMKNMGFSGSGCGVKFVAALAASNLKLRRSRWFNVSAEFV